MSVVTPEDRLDHFISVLLGNCYRRILDIDSPHFFLRFCHVNHRFSLESFSARPRQEAKTLLYKHSRLLCTSQQSAVISYCWLHYRAFRFYNPNSASWSEKRVLSVISRIWAKKKNPFRGSVEFSMVMRQQKANSMSYRLYETFSFVPSSGKLAAFNIPLKSFNVTPGKRSKIRIYVLTGS